MDKPIRVLQVTGIMNRGGAETMIMNLYRNIDRTKVQFDFVENSLEPGMFDDEIRALGGKIYYCPHFNFKNMFLYKKWWKEFFKENHEKYPIVHGHIGSTAAIYLNIAKKYGLYTIAHSHNTNSKNDLKQILYNFLAYRTRYIADYFFACSKQAGVDRFGKKISNSSRYSILKNAILTEQFQFNGVLRNKKRKELGVEDEFVVGHIGRFYDQKNHSFVIDIYSEIVKDSKKTKLLLIGEGPLKNSIIKKVEEYGLTKNVEFLGVRKDINELLQAMDVFLFPSKYEGLPVTLVEAQTAGLPCVISDGVPEDSIITKDLVMIKNILEPKTDWAEQVLSCKNKKRKNHREEVVNCGFDIKETAKYLEEFYLEKSKR